MIAIWIRVSSDDVAVREPQTAAELIEVMRLRNGEPPIWTPSEQKVELDAADADELRALGYIQ